jgi:DNA-binding Lrp family transcriptional regulator
MKKSVEKRIMDYLKKNPEGDTFTGIAKAIGVHRHTATKYIYKLIGEGKLRTRDISTAKVCYLKGKKQ